MIQMGKEFVEQVQLLTIFNDDIEKMKEQCMLRDAVNKGYIITRSVESLHNIFDDLVQEDGCILKQTADYDVRAGVTTKPIPTSDAKSVQVLHALLHTFDFYMKVVISCKARILNWSVATTSRTMRVS